MFLNLTSSGRVLINSAIQPPHSTVSKSNMKKEDASKWDIFNGPDQLTTKVRQYEKPHPARIAALGTCPVGRGALAPASRLVSYLTTADVFVTNVDYV